MAYLIDGLTKQQAGDLHDLHGASPAGDYFLRIYRQHERDEAEQAQLEADVASVPLSERVKSVLALWK